ncbi:MAG: sulfotransferase [Elusimicrobia bacterium]|nr:sulfotransferase [Elusimicrobiota bacterium]
MTNDSPIFIIGTERSGSNLLRLILNEHPSLAIPHPPHLLKDLMPLAPCYGDLGADESFRRLVDDAVTLVDLHFSPWDVRVDREEVFARAPGRSVYGVKAAIYDQYRRSKGRRRWGCKSTFVIHYVDQVLAIHPDARFIHLVRDGRDVAVSAKTSVFNHFHPHYVARLWAEQQKTAIALSRSLSAEQMICVRYEDLLDDPARETRRVCGFLGEDYSDSLLDYFKGAEAKRLAAQSRSWENVSKSVLKGNRSKYKRELSAREIHAFELQAFEPLAHYGYALENDPALLRAEARKPLAVATRLRYWTAEQAMSARMGAQALLADRNAFLRLRKNLFLRKLRLLRRA